ncbi:hypothetical protein GIB67_025205 [Kingdonia uniflora]|uniref:Peptidase S8/S53 domain-containing protein n=1 Tax=Kingdonia uniflora TaxID=39325 RepID=A0A7J7N7Y8_9MAGN|nr:hypothetical protein GIB67_025205 [Kingdonia uniflora]
MLHVDTTRTIDFLSLNKAGGLWPASNYGPDAIIGVIDSRMWPEIASFRDDRMGEIPRRDETGHGTHTTSIATGNYVRGVSYFGYAKGTTRGVAPCARLVVCKLTWSRGGSLTSNVIVGMDQALADGDDIISISIGFRGALPYEDPVSIASFAAMEKGALVSSSTGNRGSDLMTVARNPWSLTVGAITIDRQLAGTLTLGNGKTIIRWSLFPGRNYRGILKPDVVAPGSQVLALWSPKVATDCVGRNNLFLSSNYNILSGTSMTCLHASRVAALLKGAHTDWSPTAIRSAMMITVNPLDNTNNPILDVEFSRPATGLDMGVGQINLNKALNPGLIYDVGVQEYVNYICSFNFTRE